MVLPPAVHLGTRLQPIARRKEDIGISTIFISAVKDQMEKRKPDADSKNVMLQPPSLSRYPSVAFVKRSHKVLSGYPRLH